MIAHTVAQAWAVEAAERGTTPDTPGYDDAKNLFYAGAVAMMAMIVAVNPRNMETLRDFLLVVQAEMRQYLEDLDADPS